MQIKSIITKYIPRKPKNIDNYWRIERLKALYYELSAPVRHYYKTFIRIDLKKGGTYFETLIHDDPDHVKLQPKGHRNAKTVSVVKIADKPHTVESFTVGLLYTAPKSSKFRSWDYETALCFKCDVDLARKRGLRMEDGILPYIDGIDLGFTKVYIASIYNELLELLKRADLGEVSKQHRRINELRDLLEKATGLPPYIIRCENYGQQHAAKKFSDELMSEYGDNDELREWIESNQENLDDEGIEHSDSYHHALYYAQSLESLDYEGGYVSKRKKGAE
jgi:hypothetical protein